MKRLSAILMSLGLLFVLVSCGVLSNQNDKEERKEDNPQSPPSSFDDPEIEKIYRVYTDMADRYTVEKLMEVQEKEFDPAIAFGSPDPSPVAFRSDAPVFENLGFEDLDIQADYVAAFHQLRDGLEDDFSKYCKKYHPLKTNDDSCYARIQINENLQELELSLKLGDTYYFFTNCYFDQNGNRHLEYEDGYIYAVEVNFIRYTEQDGTATYPITAGRTEFWEGVSAAEDSRRVDAEDGWEEYDIFNAYDELKYPYEKHIYSDVAKLLVGTMTNAFPQQQEFRDKIDATIYNEKIVGKFDVGGINFVGQDITTRIADGYFLIEEGEYKVTTYSKRLFSLEKCKLMIYAYANRESTGTPEDNDSKRFYFYNAADGVRIVEDGVVFALNQDIDLTKPAFISENFRNIIAPGENGNGILPDEESVEFYKIGYVYFRQDGSFLVIAELPNY